MAHSNLLEAGPIDRSLTMLMYDQYVRDPFSVPGLTEAESYYFASIILRVLL